MFVECYRCTTFTAMVNWRESTCICRDCRGERPLAGDEILAMDEHWDVP